ncbi:MAG TPA: glycosyltransferase family 4 protein [Burkholderiales bacterium]
MHIVTHEDGSLAHKLAIALRGFALFSAMLVSGRIGLVHVHSASNASFWRKSVFIGLARLAGKPVIFHLHGGGFIGFYRSAGPLRPLIDRVLNQCAEIVVLTAEWKAKIQEIARNSRISVVVNPVPPACLRIVPDRKPDCEVVLFVGRLEPAKGVLDLLAAVRRIEHRFPRLTLRLAGDGDREWVAREARNLELRSRVECLGWISGERKHRALAGATVFVLPSYVEGLPVALVEAMAAGLPVVATRVGGIPSVVKTEENGFVVEPGDIDALATALARVLRDAPLQRRMGARSRITIERDFCPEKVIAQIEALYRRYGMESRITEKDVSPNPERG